MSTSSRFSTRRVIAMAGVMVATATPVLAFAQQSIPNGIRLQTLGTALADIRGLLNAVIPILIGAAVVVFLYGVLKFVLNAGDEAKRKEGKSLIVWGIVGIAVMVAVWGLVNFLINTFGVGTGGGINYPQV